MGALTNNNNECDIIKMKEKPELMAITEPKKSLINRFCSKVSDTSDHKSGIARPAQNASSSVIQRSIITEPYNYVFS